MSKWDFGAIFAHLLRLLGEDFHWDKIIDDDYKYIY